ncbi:hypothetical protein [Bacillus cytotoxicus]|uniref:hypothetical protein n=1 Tax=Bacillus cytotoxicus TaxID=580165 RepID=UPI0008640CEA|nr:hypothetical protein [Bacillus cytotoxicus]AWC30021.1 hypothetical protein CG483_017810 [Bacillus cytotoxicus]AWC42157.1 hypothetical protein CG480_017810 [Bacillus cytotoxicus]AWC50088.1 hypothetical protein CG478_017810 [Bacillus cytotoxicus]AWC54145.1 hypothetical protein CG477_018010 [Bacillus cytotoxicus]AWC58270.1 hypothetical protein CG476_018035 [Bacillus cytotoxicus]
MEIQTEQKKSKKVKPKKNKRMPLETGKINLVLCTIVGGVVGSALFAVTAYGGQTVTNISTLIGGLGGGVISGFLTLQGVKRTIELQKEKESEDSKPQKVQSIHIMIKLTEEYKLRISMLEGAVDWISKDGNTEKLYGISEHLDAKRNVFERFNDKMIKESLNVNQDLYFFVKKNLKNISSQDILLNTKILTGKFHPTEDLEEEITLLIEKILLIVLYMEDKLEQELTKYEQSLFRY